MEERKMSGENTYNSIEEILNKIPGNYKILEETIDVEVQKEYFDASVKLKGRPIDDNVDDLAEIVNTSENELPQRKEALQKLALIDSVEAYRAIEQINKTPEGEIKDWAILALQQSRMLMQSSLLDEQQVFISTGLGGKADKLRYYLIFPYNNIDSINETQQKILANELIYFIEKHNGEVEEVFYHSKYATAMALIPLVAPIPEIVKEILGECNQYGNYLSKDVMITNIKKFNDKEILNILEDNKTQDS